MTRRLLRRIWIALGLAITGWIYIGFQASGVPEPTLHSDAVIHVTSTGGVIEFRPASPRATSLLFLPGGMVEPIAYAPLLRRIAEAGYAARLLRLPMRCACTESQISDVFDTIEHTLKTGSWVLAGHSRGAMLSTRYVHERSTKPAGLALIGTTHPRDFSLAALTIPVMKIYGTRDGVAPVSGSRKELLPAHTRWVPIEGGNHVQFGYYRHQFFDDDATITRDEQQRLVLEALVGLLTASHSRP